MPILFLSGLDDELIPAVMMHTLFQFASSDIKHLHQFEGGTHNFTWHCSNYYSIINTFISKVVLKTNNSEKTISKADLIWNQIVPEIFTFTETKDSLTSFIIFSKDQNDQKDHNGQNCSA